MGSGIAQVAATSGFHTFLFDVNERALEKAKVLIFKNLDYLLSKEKISGADREHIVQRLYFISHIRLCRADLIIEAIIEDENAKLQLFQELSEYNDDGVIFATNTSSLSVNSIQQKIKDAGRFLGMHFFNPAYIMKLVEVVAGNQTKKETLDEVAKVCEQMNKTPVLCKDSPGFIVNRVARHYYLEALRIAEEGVADFESIDAIMEASGFKMGPFKLMDLIGIDINLAVSQSLYNAFDGEPRFKPSLLQEEKVKASELGKKTGRGFYSYQNKRQ